MIQDILNKAFGLFEGFDLRIFIIVAYAMLLFAIIVLAAFKHKTIYSIKKPTEKARVAYCPNCKRRTQYTLEHYPVEVNYNGKNIKYLSLIACCKKCNQLHMPPCLRSINMSIVKEGATIGEDINKKYKGKRNVVLTTKHVGPKE